jgi:hypothetical protein
MGFFNYVTSIGSKAKGFLNRGIAHVKKGKSFSRRMLSGINQFVDRILDTAHSYPLLSELADQIERSDYYNTYKHASGQISSFLDKADDVVESVEGFVNGYNAGLGVEERPMRPTIPNPLIDVSS